MTPVPPPNCTPTESLKTVSWMDRWAGALFHWLHGPLARQAAGEVARECRPALLSRALEAIEPMSIPQSLGYVRALAPGFVDREIDAVISRRRISPSLRTRIFAEAIEQVIALVVDDIARLRSATGSARMAKAA
ncbi:MAG: hypothetical protein ABSG86_00825 [Thermoguttaceae bacterium]